MAMDLGPILFKRWSERDGHWRLFELPFTPKVAQLEQRQRQKRMKEKCLDHRLPRKRSLAEQASLGIVGVMENTAEWRIEDT